MWLGFSPASNQYKVLRNFASFGGVYGGAQVLVVGSNSWRDVDDRSLAGRRHSRDSTPAFLNGLVYWLDERLLDVGFFDFDMEIFGGIPLPFDIGEDARERMSAMSIGVIGGSLCVSYNEFNTALVQIWVMKKQGGGGSWIKEFVIDMERPIHGRLKPLQLLGDGEILMLWACTSLVCYDSRTKSVRYLGSNLLKYKHRAIAFTPSFIPLKDTLLVDQVVVQYVRPRGYETEL